MALLDLTARVVTPIAIPLRKCGADQFDPHHITIISRKGEPPTKHNLSDATDYSCYRIGVAGVFLFPALVVGLDVGDLWPLVFGKAHNGVLQLAQGQPSFLIVESG